MDNPGVQFDPRPRLERFWAETRNPAFVWCAIDFCVTEQKEFPEWVIEYLGKCAARMMAKDAGAPQLRSVLPRIFGFSGQMATASKFSRKRGPSNPLHVFRDMLNAEKFAIEFARLMLGPDQPSARRARDCAAEKMVDY